MSFRGQGLESWERGLYFNAFIRFLLEAYLEINTAAFVNLLNVSLNISLNTSYSSISVMA